jgi:DNA-binding IclR family transcriptional regulator
MNTTVRAYAAMNTLRALEWLAFRPLSAPELADGLQIGEASARRLLQRLALEGYVVQEGGHRRRYRATLRLAAVGRQLVRHAALPQAAAPCVARLAATTGCTAHLWVRSFDDLVCVVHAPPPTRTVPEPQLAELIAAGERAAGSVLETARARARSCTYLREAEGPAAAASVIDGGEVVAALAVNGESAADALRDVVRSAAELTAQLDGRSEPLPTVCHVPSARS